MLGSLRMRLFLVLVMVVLALVGPNSRDQSRERAEPVFDYVIKPITRWMPTCFPCWIAAAWKNGFGWFQLRTRCGSPIL